MNKIKTAGIVFLWLFVQASISFAEKPEVISSPGHQRILNESQSKADAYCAKNLNRFGLEELQRYDKALDTLFAREMTDTLAAIQNNYIQSYNKRKADTGDLQSQFNELNQTKESYSAKYHGLLRKAGTAFIIWLVIILIILRWRKSRVRKSQLALDSNTAQLKTSEQFFLEGEELFKASNEWNEKAGTINPVAEDIQKSVAALGERLSPEAFKSEEFKTLQKNSGIILTNSSRLGNLSKVIIEQHGEPGQEKVLTNINVLCDQYADLAYTGIEQEGDVPAIQITKDFEKNLPMLKIAPEGVGSLLISVLDNAFMSVIAKQKRAVKGYVPKVSVSTRVLPRFIQIRVKDNGDGIPDEVMERIYEPFYSTKPTGEGAGLGMYYGDIIIKENNGELKIESEKGNSTDVYIKFFLQPSGK